MNIFLISNDPNLTEQKILDINIKNNDLICLFNHANPLKYANIYNHDNKYLFLRRNEIGFHGLESAVKNQTKYKSIFLLGIDKTLPLSKIKITNPKMINCVSVKEYPVNKYPTSGFCVFLYIKENYPKDDIFLVNFTGTGSKGKPWPFHDYEFEQHYYKNNNIIIL